MATLVIAKLDRLSRNAAFLLALRDSWMRFSAVDLPEANDLTVGITALVAQQEREVAISAKLAMDLAAAVEPAKSQAFLPRAMPRRARPTALLVRQTRPSARKPAEASQRFSK